jgi:hypothetical protein
MQSRFKIFFSVMLLTTALPFIPYVFPFIPGQIFGFNLTGWAWMIMLLVTLVNLLGTRLIDFPIWLWAPWLAYLIVYIIIDYSFLGLQLTLQYTLPILVGIVASGFSYSEDDLLWIFKWFTRLCIAVIVMFAYGYLFRNGYTPATAAVPMLLSILFSIFIALYFITAKKRYLLYAGILFLAPVIDVTRMGIASMAAIFILHFANRNIRDKLFYGLLGALVLIIVFNTKGFQEKTFYGKQGKLSDLTINYYGNPNMNTSGRSSWKNALEPGLKAAPIWGNGPRADITALYFVSKNMNREAHNDYLSMRYNYGYVGLVILLFGFAATFFSLYRLSLKHIENDYLWLISTSALTLFISFLMFMYSDNILKYTIYFPNYFFALIGIVYSLKRDEDLSGYTPLQ